MPQYTWVCSNDFGWILLLIAFIAGALVSLGVCWLTGPGPDKPGSRPPRG